jgi:hypothetical protein
MLNYVYSTSLIVSYAYFKQRNNNYENRNTDEKTPFLTPLGSFTKMTVFGFIYYKEFDVNFLTLSIKQVTKP